MSSFLVKNIRILPLLLSKPNCKRNNSNLSKANNLRQKMSVSTTCVNLNNKIATFEDVQAVKDNKNVILIDVREPSELTETGSIPGSINIPLGQVESVLKDMTNDEFQKLYGRDKPKQDFPIIFSCKAGKRGEMAQNTALQLGWKNVRNYAGAWQEWAEKNRL